MRVLKIWQHLEVWDEHSELYGRKDISPFYEYDGLLEIYLPPYTKSRSVFMYQMYIVAPLVLHIVHVFVEMFSYDVTYDFFGESRKELLRRNQYYRENCWKFILLFLFILILHRGCCLFKPRTTKLENKGKLISKKKDFGNSCYFVSAMDRTNPVTPIWQRIILMPIA